MPGRIDITTNNWQVAVNELNSFGALRQKFSNKADVVEPITVPPEDQRPDRALGVRPPFLQRGQERSRTDFALQ